MDVINGPQQYMDFKGIDELRIAAKKGGEAANEKVAEAFEGMFVSMLLKSMRQANQAFEADSPMNSRSVKFYQQMYDSELATNLSGGQGLGLKAVIMRQLSPNSHQQTGPLNHERLQAYTHTAADKRPAQAASSGAPTGQEVTRDHLSSRELANRDLSNLKPSSSNVPEPQAAPNLTEADAAPQLSGGLSRYQPFVDAVWPHLRTAATELATSPITLLAQTVLETGWGKKIITDKQGNSGNNLFNIKANRNWQGASNTKASIEYQQQQPTVETSQFKAYPTIKASVQDYIDFIKQGRYQSAIGVKGAKQYAATLQQAGYATDPNYSDKIAQIAALLRQGVN